MSPKKHKKTSQRPNSFQKSSDEAGRLDNSSSMQFLGAWSRWEPIGRYLAYVMIVLAVLTGFGYVYAYGVNILWEDEWDTLPQLFQQYDTGTLSFAEFWKPHNEHRIFFPKIAFYGLGWLTNGNVVVNMYATVFLLLGILAMFLVAFRRRFTGGLEIWLIVPAAFLLFSYRQCQNYLMGFQLTLAMVAIASTYTFFCLSRIRMERFRTMFVAAILSATIAAYSSIHGLFVWPVGLGQIFLLSLPKRRKILLMSVWSVVGAIEWLTYFIGYASPSHHPPYRWSWDYLFTIIGGGLFDHPNTAWVTGALFFLLAIVAGVIVLVKREWAAQSFWIAVLAFSFISMGSVVIGRSGFGVDQSLASRYATFSIPGIIAIYILLLPRPGEKFFLSGMLLTGTALGLMIVGTGQAAISGMALGREFRDFRQYAQTAVCTIESQPDEMITELRACGTGETKDIIMSGTTILKKLKLNIFADEDLYARNQLASPSLKTLPNAPQYKITSIDPSPIGSLRIIKGWAIDGAQNELAGGVTIVLDGMPYPACYGLPSEAAVAKFGKNFANAGFACVVPARALGHGPHMLVVKVLNRDRTGVYATPKPFQVTIKDPAR